MRVDGNRPVRSASARPSERTGGSGNFAEALAGDEPVSAPATATPLAGVGALFALQEVADSTAQRRKAMARAQHILDRLGDLQLGLLTGTIDRRSLADLAASARAARGATDDPGLQGVLNEIELRAAVELAKLSTTL
jgi:hypothetical protein